MNINRKIKEIEKKPELMGIGAVLALIALLLMYKVGVLIGGVFYQFLN